MRFPPFLNFKEIATRLGGVWPHDDPELKELVSRAGDDEAVHLLDSLPPPKKRRMFRLLPVGRRARILLRSSGYSQAAVSPSLHKEEIRQMIDAVESDEAVDLIQLLEAGTRAKIISDLQKSDPHGLLPLLVFGEETAGGIMKTEVIRVRSDQTVDEARRSLAQDPAAAKHRSHHVYVVENGEVLAGMLPLIRLLASPPEARIAAVMHPPPATVPPAMDQEEVAKTFDEHNAIELPVVGAKGRLIGCITADDIFEVMEKEHTEDISRLTGAGEDEHISDPVWLTVRRRLPWLVVNLATAVLAAGVVSLFQDTIQKIVILAAFMPIIAGMGGNAATQTLGVVVRAIALGELHHLNTARSVGKEVLAGTVNGFMNGLIMAAVAVLWTKNWTLALVLLVAMTANLLVAGLGGVVVPVVMKSLRIDPALASTVFVTTLTDVCGFFVFLGLASVLI